MSAHRRHLAAFASGGVFGLGLAISQMINPQKVQAFLDVAGQWDPSLALVMGAALCVTLVAFRFVLRAPRPLLEPDFHLPTRRDIEPKLLTGAAVFGVGWGLAGYCPGPAIAALPLGSAEPLIFIVAMIAGSLAAKALLK